MLKHGRPTSRHGITRVALCAFAPGFCQVPAVGEKYAFKGWRLPPLLLNEFGRVGAQGVASCAVTRVLLMNSLFWIQIQTGRYQPKRSSEMIAIQLLVTVLCGHKVRIATERHEPRKKRLTATLWTQHIALLQKLQLQNRALSTSKVDVQDMH